jgi:ribonuclease P protein component
LRRAQRLTQTRLFEETYAQGRAVHGRWMVMWLRAGEGAALRLGVVTSRKIGGAVQRARARRRLREAWRLNRWRFNGAFDVVLVARRGILQARWDDVQSEVLGLAERAGLGRGKNSRPQ